MVNKTKEQLENDLAESEEKLLIATKELEQLKAFAQQISQRLQSSEAENKFLFESMETVNTFRKERDLATSQLQRGKKNVQTKKMDR